MIQKEDILSMAYLKKTEYTGCNQGMRYRLEKAKEGEGEVLLVTIWPEPFNFFNTPAEQKTSCTFTFDEDGVTDAIAWMNDRLFEQKDKWDSAPRNWSDYVKLKEEKEKAQKAAEEAKKAAEEAKKAAEEARGNV